MLIKIKNKIGASALLVLFESVNCKAMQFTDQYFGWWFDGLFYGEGLVGCFMPGYLDLT